MLSRRAFAAKKRDYILIGQCNPSSGPLSGFGESAQWADDRVLAEINKDGGIFIKEAGKKLPVRIKLMDTESDPTKAADVASSPRCAQAGSPSSFRPRSRPWEETCPMG